MIRRIGWVLCAMGALSSAHAQTLPTAKPEQVGLSADKLKAVDEAVAQHIEAKDISGAVVLIARNGKVAYRRAQGTFDGATPVREDTIFWVASMTKPIVATAVLQMMEAGKLKLADPVSRFIPEFATPGVVRVLKPGSPAPTPPTPGAPPDPNAPKPQYDLVPAERAITVQDLLTHTAGLQSIGVPNDALPTLMPGDTLATRIPKLATVPRDFQAGSKWAYSNATGFDVLARIVEVTSGQPFDAYVQQHIFNPLGMTSSSFGPNKDQPARNMPLGPPLGTDPCITGVTFKCGSAGLWISIDDYAHFAQMLLNGGEFKGHRLLKPSTVKLMTTNHTGTLYPGNVGIPGADKGVDMALSMVVVDDASRSGLAVPTGSFGWDGVSTRRFWVIPKEKMVIVMMIPSGKGAPVHRDVERAVMSALN